MAMAIERFAAKQHRLERCFRTEFGLRTAMQYHQVCLRDVGAVELRVAFEHVRRTLDVAVVSEDVRIRLKVARDIQGVAEDAH